MSKVLRCWGTLKRGDRGKLHLLGFKDMTCTDRDPETGKRAFLFQRMVIPWPEMVKHLQEDMPHLKFEIVERGDGKS